MSACWQSGFSGYTGGRSRQPGEAGRPRARCRSKIRQRRRDEHGLIICVGIQGPRKLRISDLQRDRAAASTYEHVPGELAAVVLRAIPMPMCCERSTSGAGPNGGGTRRARWALGMGGVNGPGAAMARPQFRETRAQQDDDSIRTSNTIVPET